VDRVEAIVGEELVSSHGFSVDGHKAETVEAIRVKAKLPVILGNIENLIRTRERMGKHLPRITVRYTLMRMNIEELPMAVHQWGKMGIDTVVCNYVSLANGIDRKESLFFHQELTRQHFQKARQAAGRYPHLTLELPELITDQTRYRTRPKKCMQPWNFVMIDTNGAVLPCYQSFEALSMGNIYTERHSTFDTIWNSHRYQSLRATVNAQAENPLHRYCARCESRFGWGSIEPHLGDDSWLQAINEGREQLIEIDHRRGKTARH
jgi:radical SAM protein with 4Fe4S-binding SPASM domain